MKPFFFFLCFLFLFGCEKATKYNSSPRDNFEALWRIMDENYCFFAFKDVDWDDVYDRYNLLVKDTMNQYELFDILGKMLAEVKDGHTNLISSFDMSRYWAWYEDYPANFYKEIQCFIASTLSIPSGPGTRISLNGCLDVPRIVPPIVSIPEKSLDVSISKFEYISPL